MKRYKEYKDSGVEWIGEIPSHWNISKLKYIVNTTKGFAFKSELFESEGTPVVKASDIKNKTIVCIDNYINDSIATKYRHVKLLEGDIIMSTVGSTPDVKNSAVGQLAYIPKDVEGSLLNQNTVILRIDKNNLMDNRYLFYILCSSTFRSYLDLYAHGTANQASLSLADILSYDISIPRQLEQKEMTKYLDKKTSQIETLISKKEELIETLKASRSKLISETVTKGLDKDVPMKDSGVEWIGEIPSHWDISKVKYKVDINKNVLSEKTSGDYEINYIDIGSVNSYGEVTNTEVMEFKDSPSRARRIVKSQDTLISTVRTYLKAITCIDEADDNLICSTGFAVLSPSKELDYRYLGMMFRSPKYIDEIVKRSKGVSYPAITSTEIGDMQLILPPLEEQKKIADKLYVGTSNIDKIILKTQEQIELLKKAKQKLITEVVTGKIDVINL